MIGAQGHGPFDPGFEQEPEDLDELLRERLDVGPLVAERRRSLSDRIMLWLSGADGKILAMMPTEEKKYQLLGMLVAATGVLAFGATTWALNGVIGFGAALGIGLILGLAVLVVDRALVALPLNPVKLPKSVGQSLWDPAAGGGKGTTAAVFNEIVDTRQRGRLRTALGVGFRLIPRVAVALCLSFIIAEAVLLVRFQDDIDRRARAILDVTRSSSQTSINAYYKSEIDRKRAEIADLETGGRAGETTTITDRMAASTATQEQLSSDINVLEELWQAEKNGRVVTRALSDGTSFTTSGKSKCLERCQSYKQAQAKLRDQLATVNQAIADDQALLKGIADAAAQRVAENQPAIAAANDAIAALQAAQRARLDEIAADVKPSVLLQIQALEELAQDPTPAVREENDVLIGAAAAGEATPGVAAGAEAATCSGGWLSTASCSVRQWLIPSTPLGPQIAAWRYFFLLFDLMPILAKAVLSLRRVRPYDEVEAGLAMIQRLRILNSVDWQLNQVGADWEDRAAERRSRRAISDAMVFEQHRPRRRTIKIGPAPHTAIAVPDPVSPPAISPPGPVVQSDST